ncbi:MAG: 2-oxoglutarate and iron-dependent oxygenase domain-containing protein, partial [Acidimicrobiales bacterium]
MSQDTNISDGPRRPAFEPLSLDGLRWHGRDEIPAGVLVFDYDELLGGAHRDALREALAGGIPFYLENHGIPEAGTEAAFNAARGFFREPEERKEEMVHPRLPRIIRGYSGYG